MIPKGNARGGGQQLATHLMNSFDNERVEIADLRGAVANDLHGAFAEWRATATATKCRKYIYSLSVNPDPAQGPLTREQYFDFISRTEEKLKLTDQPRAVVFHVKEGREHAHIVWSRINPEKLKAVQLSYDHDKLRSVAREFARDHGLTLPPGMQQDRGKDRYKNRAKQENLTEKQQQERSGISKAERMREITEAWRSSDTAKALIDALEERGYVLARGDKIPFVVIDRAGEIHSLPKQIDGANTNAVRARLAGYPIEKIPSIEAAQKLASEREQAKRDVAALKARETEQRARLDKTQGERRTTLDTQRDAMRARHNLERQALTGAQQAKDGQILAQRLARQPKGVVAFLARVTGFQALAALQRKVSDRLRAQQHKQQQEALQRRHGREAHEMDRRYRAAAAIEQRERRGLNMWLRRDRLRATWQEKTRAQEITPKFNEAAKAQLDERGRGAPPSKSPPPQTLTPKQLEASEQIQESARDATEAGRDSTPGKAADSAPALTAAFDRVAARKQRRQEQEKDNKRDPGRERGRDPRNGR